MLIIWVSVGEREKRTKSLIRKISLILANATTGNLLFPTATAEMFRRLFSYENDQWANYFWRNEGHFFISRGKLSFWASGYNGNSEKRLSV
jgi:hypothetical protein